MKEDNINNKSKVAYLTTSLGILKITADKEGLESVQFTNTKPHNNIPDECQKAYSQLSEYFQGKRKEFKINIKLQGTPFQQQVYKELSKIPYGTTKTYKQIANNIEKQNAQRAVGNANNKNKLLIIIPCHRVVGSNGKLTGYAGGIDKKQWLLEFETTKTSFTKEFK